MIFSSSSDGSPFPRLLEDVVLVGGHCNDSFVVDILDVVSSFEKIFFLGFHVLPESTVGAHLVTIPKQREWVANVSSSANQLIVVGVKV